MADSAPRFAVKIMVQDDYIPFGDAEVIAEEKTKLADGTWEAYFIVGLRMCSAGKWHDDDTPSIFSVITGPIGDTGCPIEDLNEIDDVYMREICADIIAEMRQSA